MKYDKEFLIKMYKELLNVRMIEEKLVEIYSLGMVPGHIHSGVGEEAAFVGTLATRKENDIAKVTHRVIAATHVLGITMDEIFAEILGKETGTSKGRGGVNHIGHLENGILGTAGALGSDTTVAIGAALTAKYKKTGNIVYAYYGDGTSSRGTIHEAMNMAAVWKLPVLFICTNNEYAISAHVSNTVSVKNPGADRAVAYNMPGKVVDGNDVLAVYETAKELEAYVREGNGPALLETKCYRWRGHYEGDQTPYRDHEYALKQQENCCIKKYEAYLSKNGVLSEEEMETIKSGISEALTKAVEFASKSPEPNLESVYDQVYA